MKFLIYLFFLFPFCYTASAQGRFSPSADGQEITDKQKNLVWKRCAHGMSFSAGKCTGTATRMTYQSAKSLASESTDSQWRLPVVQELQSLADRASGNPAIDPVAFPDTPPSWFWAFSPGDSVSDFVWFVDFFDGSTKLNGFRSGQYFVRLVRNDRR